MSEGMPYAVYVTRSTPFIECGNRVEITGKQCRNTARVLNGEHWKHFLDQSLRHNFPKETRWAAHCVLKSLPSLQVGCHNDCRNAVREPINSRVMNWQAIFVEQAGPPAGIQEDES
jgi:hypothetical protein